MTSQNAPSAQLLLEHGRWIRAFARRLVSPSDADDLVQETWITALKDGGSQAPSRAWLATVARRIASRKHRGDRHRQDRETFAAHSQSRAQAPTPEELVARGETQRQVVDIVLGLGEPNRSALLLRYYEGLTPKEIAERLGVEAGTVRVRLSRGTAQVREKLDELSEGDSSRWMSALAPLTIPLGVPAAPDGAGAAKAAAPKLAAAGSGISGAAIALVAAVILAAIGIVSLLLQDGRTAPQNARLVEVAQTAQAHAPDPDALETPSVARTAAASLVAPTTSTVFSGTNREPETGTITLIDPVTSQPAAHVRFSLPVESDNRADLETIPVWETDANGEAIIPIETTSVMLRHTFDSSIRAHEFFEPHVGASAPEAVPVAWQDGEALVQVDCGYTVRLDFDDASVETGDLFAILSRNERMTTWAVYQSEVRTADGQSFVRFPRIEGGTRGYWLHLVSRDGVLGASYSTHDYVDSSAALQVQMTPRGCLRGTLVPDVAGELMNARLKEANVMLFRGSVTANDIELPYMENVPELHRLPRETPRSFQFVALEPGDYTLCVHARGFAPLWIPRRVEAGDTASTPVEMGWLNEPTATLRGVITSRTGTYAEPMIAFIRDEQIYMPTQQLDVEVTWTSDGDQSIGTFEVPGLAIQTYRVALFGGSRFNPHRLPHLAPSSGVEAVPGEPLEIELTDDVETRALAVQVSDAVTGDPVEWFDMTAFPASGDPSEIAVGVLEANGQEGAARFESVVVGFEYRLSVLADGYMMEDTTFTLDADSGVLEIELRPGWVGYPYCVDHSGAPLQGVEVLCDGVLAGVTDENGMLLLNLTETPERVEFLLDGEAPASTDFADSDGLLKGEIAQGGRMLNATFDRS